MTDRAETDCIQKSDIAKLSIEQKQDYKNKNGFHTSNDLLYYQDHILGQTVNRLVLLIDRRSTVYFQWLTIHRMSQLGELG